MVPEQHICSGTSHFFKLTSVSPTNLGVVLPKSLAKEEQLRMVLGGVIAEGLLDVPANAEVVGNIEEAEGVRFEVPKFVECDECDSPLPWDQAKLNPVIR